MSSNDSTFSCTNTNTNGVKSSTFKHEVADFRLLQLISPSLPIGAFTYSQGLEWAVETNWVTDKVSLTCWLKDILYHSLVTLELPILLRIHRSIEQSDIEQVKYWSQWLHASRETSELRKEEKQRGKATATLLNQLDVKADPQLLILAQESQLVGFALAANHWGISSESLCSGYLWSWLENVTMSGVKLVPLGQTAGQQILLLMSTLLPAALEASYQVKSHEIGSFTPAQAIASSRHETQYTRLFRS
ncbi:urease accessory protein UreF [Photobacterium profundum]|uniref:urease accessory protein UreF n=1 Tax=Photobacterium profundum TaxID=74109 RepID=UPI003D0EC1C7